MKFPKQRQDISAEIKPTEIRYDPENNPPRFSFRDIIKDSKFNYNSLEREKSGCEIIDRKALKFSIPDGVPAECDILAFRFDGIAPMLGYRSAFGTFYIIAFDSKCEAYDHG